MLSSDRNRGHPDWTGPLGPHRSKFLVRTSPIHTYKNEQFSGSIPLALLRLLQIDSLQALTWKTMKIGNILMVGRIFGLGYRGCESGRGFKGIISELIENQLSDSFCFSLLNEEKRPQL